jgi:hypothetical protein
MMCLREGRNRMKNMKNKRPYIGKHLFRTAFVISMLLLLTTVTYAIASPGAIGEGSGIAIKSITTNNIDGSLTGISIGKLVNLHKNTQPWNINPQDISFYYYGKGNIFTNPNNVAVLINLANLHKGVRIIFDWYDNKDKKISTRYYDIPDPKYHGYSYWKWESVYSCITSLCKGSSPTFSGYGHYYVKITSNLTKSGTSNRVDFDVIPANSILQLPKDMVLYVPLIPYGNKDKFGYDILALPFEGGGTELQKILLKYRDIPSIADYSKTNGQYYKSFPNIRKGFAFQTPGYAPVHATQVNDMSNSFGYDKNGKYYDFWGECVSLVKTMTLVDANTVNWFAGNYVMNMTDITPGTVVAIFSKTRTNNKLPLYNGDCVNSCSPRHVAIFEDFVYVNNVKKGFKVLDQNYDSKGVIELHNIYISPTNSKQYDDAGEYRIVNWLDPRLLAG